MTKGGKQEVAAVGHNSYAGTRFNAVKHAVLSRYTVLPWEDETEYGDLLEALVGEHTPEGPTETHLVEKLAGIFWRKRRLRREDRHDPGQGRHLPYPNRGRLGRALRAARGRAPAPDHRC